MSTPPNSPIAVIDMGTNTFLLLIGKVEDGEISYLYREQQFVRLGKGGISKGQIAPDAIERGIDTLNQYREIATRYQAESIVAVATSALRNAANQKEVVRAFEECAGISPVIIDGQNEAQLIYEGICQTIPSTDKPVLAMDIGGGSVEFILGKKEEILWKHSFEIGAQRLFDLFFTNDPFPREMENELMAYLQEQLSPLYKACEQYQPEHFIGSAGTFDTLWDLSVGKVGDMREERILSKEEFLQIQELLLRKNQSFRLAMPGMIDKRVDLIVVASCLVRYVFDQLSFSEVRIAQGALKEGALARLLQNKALTDA